MPLTKSQINRLGDRLRAPGELRADLLEELQEFRGTFDAPMQKAQALLQERLGIEATARLKTVNTLIEKLRRERTRLSEMQDIGGLRVVEELSLAEQDDLVNRILALFPGARLQDRRATPSHGYRAVHVIATVDEHRIEIQVRTRLQDGWAQAMEKLADIVGRDIRYGGDPQWGGDEAKSFVRILQRLSRGIALCEAMDLENRAVAQAMAASARDLLAAVGELMSDMLRRR